MGSSFARVTCETSQVLLAGGQVFFLGNLPTLRLTRLKMSEIILTSRKTQIIKSKQAEKGRVKKRGYTNRRLVKGNASATGSLNILIKVLKLNGSKES